MMMKQKRVTVSFFAGLVAAGLMALNGCKSQTKNADEASSGDRPGEVMLVSGGMNFKMADSVYAGWNTFTYKNESADVHLFMIEKYPGGRGLEAFQQELVPVFQKAMDEIIAGNRDSAMAAFGAFPAWAPGVVYVGGSGLIGPGKVSVVTLPLDPGTYVMECYVKMPDGKFHAAMGMATEFFVRNDSSDHEPPNANIHINLSSANGMELQGEPAQGQQVFAVHYSDQKAYENFLGHDVNLVRLSEGASLDTLQHWVNWMEPHGLVSPAPAGFEFLGGAQDMPAGTTGYFTVELGPGKYALISEVPDAGQRNLVQTFTVP